MRSHSKWFKVEYFCCGGNGMAKFAMPSLPVGIADSDDREIVAVAVSIGDCKVVVSWVCGLRLGSSDTAAPSNDTAASLQSMYADRFELL
jgi:hypothetical protein